MSPLFGRAPHAKALQNSRFLKNFGRYSLVLCTEALLVESDLTHVAHLEAMEEELWPTVVAWTIYLGATTAAAVAGSLWWRKEKKGARKSARKPPASSPGIRVAKIQVWSTIIR